MSEVGKFDGILKGIVTLRRGGTVSVFALNVFLVLGLVKIYAEWSSSPTEPFLWGTLVLALVCLVLVVPLFYRLASRIEETDDSP